MILLTCLFFYLQKHFVDEARKAISSHHGGSSKALLQTEGAAVTFVRMCKASTYININDRPNVLFTLVQSVTHDLKVTSVPVLLTQFFGCILNISYVII